MCGLSGYFARESGERDVLGCLFKEAEKRGSDGFGWVKLNNICLYLNSKKYKGIPLTEKAISDIGYLCTGDILLSNHRAAPETEREVSQDELNETVQPIINVGLGLYLVHNGAVSNFIVDELKEEFDFKTNIDSEAIIWAYEKFNRNMEKTMEYLSGGFAFLMVDSGKRKLYAVCTHNPLYVGYVRGAGLFFSSTEEGVFSTVSYLKGTKIERNTVNIWEDYYAHRLPEYTIVEIDIDSGMVNQKSFEPRYITNTYDGYKDIRKNTSAVLVAASSGLDSSVTLATLAAAGMNPIAVHFNYGHRGGDAEWECIQRVTNILNVPLYTFDISEQMKILDSGMLTDKNAEIITGTNKGLKTTAAWTVYRNHFFMTYMAALAEKLIMNGEYSEIYLTGGFMNLSESGSFPDNSERFVDAALKFFKYSITGTKLKPLYGLCNILKTEQYILLKELGLLEKLSPWLISCDRPIISEYTLKEDEKLPTDDFDVIHTGFNCSKNGKPACGSGLLSYWAAKTAGVPDLRRYYEVDDPNYVAYEPNTDYTEKEFDIEKIVDKIQIPQKNRELLLDTIHRRKQ